MNIEKKIVDNYLKFLSMFLILAIPFIILHRSDKPFLGPYSLEFIIFILLPYVFSFYFIRLNEKKNSFIKIVFLKIRKINLPVRYLIFFFFSFLSSLLFLIVPINYLGSFLFLSTFAIVLFIYMKIFDRIEILIFGYFVIGFGIILFSLELIQISNFNFFNNKNEILYWGDQTTFSDTFKKKEPFISIGGRLKPNLNVKMSSPENISGVLLKTNSIGFRNSENFKNKLSKNEIRILNLGDSQSIGYGVGQNSFFGGKLKINLQKEYSNLDINILNVEISDPAYGAYYFKNYGQAFNPQIMIFGLTTNDVFQAYDFFGDTNLFKFDKTGNIKSNDNFMIDNLPFIKKYQNFKYYQKYKILKKKDYHLINQLNNRIKGFFLTRKLQSLISSMIPKIDKVSIFSYLAELENEDGFKRLFDGSTNLGFFYKKDKNRIDKIYESSYSLLKYMKQLCEENKMKFIVFLHPLRYQVNKNDWKILCDRWNLNPKDFDLNLHNKRVKDFCIKEGIHVIDPIDLMMKIDESLFLRNDMHSNSKGHEVLSDIAAQNIIKNYSSYITSFYIK